MQLSVIIVNYNVKYFLEQCLYSVLKASKHTNAEIIVVDNHSTDGSATYLPDKFPAVQFIWNKENVGFAKANNQALAVAKGSYILFLNPDTILPEDCFDQCISFFQQNPLAGALGIRMVDGSGQFLKESKRAFPSPLTSLFKLSGLTQLFPHSKILARYHLGHLPDNQNHEVDVLAGAFIMLPKNILQKVGSFDESFFMYGEDVDLSYRIQQAGYKNYYFADSTIIHFKGESTKKGSLNYVRLFYQAMSLFVKKHYSGGKASVFIFLVRVAIWVRALFAAGGKLLQRLGLPLIDAGLILMSFWVVKFWWSKQIRQEVNYSPQMLTIAFPVFTIIFLAASFFAGLYFKGYKPVQLFRAVFFSALILMSGYALLPEAYRFSRGILVFGILLALIGMWIARWLFVQWGLLLINDEDEEHRQTMVVANEKDFKIIGSLMELAGLQDRVLGRINNNTDNSAAALGNTNQLPHIINMYPVKEIIFCENGFSFKDIIQLIQTLPGTVRYKFHASQSTSIVGSDSSNISGEYVAADKKYRIGLSINKRNKWMADILLALILLASFPFHLFFQKRPRRFFKNLFHVLLTRKTWVGYALSNNDMPPLKKGILTSTGLPAALNHAPSVNLRSSDEWYASTYSILNDWKRVIRSYKYLSS